VRHSAPHGRPGGQFIGNEFVSSAGTATIEVVDPSTEEVIGTVPAGTAADAGRAVTAAAAAFESWQYSTVEDRIAVLDRIRAGIEARRAEFAELISAEMGMPRSWSDAVQVGNPLAVLADYSRILRQYQFTERRENSLVTQEPAGVVVAIAPWNLPLHQALAKVVPALAAGCTVVLKPSEVTPLDSYLLAEIARDAGTPPGVLNIVHGTGPEIGEPLVVHPGVDVVSFTGSLAAGRRVGELAARTVKRVTLELGGKSPSILLDDADLGTVVPEAVRYGAFLNNGQVCSAFTRLIVPRAVAPDVLDLARETAESLTVGPASADLDLGPLVSRAQRDRVVGYIRAGLDEGATLVTGGPEPPAGLRRGFFVRPTVFGDVTPGMTIARDEIFGPVLTVIAYDTEEEAVAIANDTIYGLAGAVYSASLERGMAVARRLRAGQVNVNGGAFNVCAPFGGYKQSGNGREFGVWGLAEFLETKSYQLPPDAA
jgi:acyl-CoA reductase-like NAD-dependent aldehyde dehydrogenase